jgi:plasmid stabilization system protein ParE
VNPPLILNPEAEVDLVEAKAWYDGRRPGLGDDFLLCVEEVFEGIRRLPRFHPEVFQGLRLALVRRFPFAVVYHADESQITVLAIYHTRRDPRGWQDRI